MSASDSSMTVSASPSASMARSSLFAARAKVEAHSISAYARAMGGTGRAGVPRAPPRPPARCPSDASGRQLCRSASPAFPGSALDSDLPTFAHMLALWASLNAGRGRRSARPRKPRIVVLRGPDLGVEVGEEVVIAHLALHAEPQHPVQPPRGRLQSPQPLGQEVARVREVEPGFEKHL